MDWQAIKPEDGTAPQSFTMILTGCSNTMTDITYMEDLDNRANIKALANKLGESLLATHRKKDKEKSTVQDVLNVFNQQVWYLLYLLYGNIKETTTSTKNPVQQ